MSINSENLRISEIFFSLQGETQTTGLPTVFVRLTGCPLRCHYCDTAYAFTGGEKMSIDEIAGQVTEYAVKHVTITGGEPLAQKNCNELMTRLCDLGHEVSLETSGAVSVAGIDPRVVKVMDVKTPGSGEVEKNLYENFKILDDKDQIKFVICNEDDYDWCREIINKHQLNEGYQILFSPSHEELEPGVLADWILRDKLSVRLQIQLHKYLWGNVPGR
jgi:7-carboxy-7-deazaguanine synthase